MWITKDNREIAFCDLTDAHLTSILQMMICDAERKRLLAIKQFLLGRGRQDVASRTWTNYCDPQIIDIMAEYVKRDLSELAIEEYAQGVMKGGQTFEFKLLRSIIDADAKNPETMPEMSEDV